MPSNLLNKVAAQMAANIRVHKPKRPPRGGRGAQVESIGFAETVNHRSYFRLSHRKRKGSDVLVVSLKDAIGALYGPSRQDGFKSDAIPFTLASNDSSLAKTGQIFPKLQGFARIASRYQVKKARLHYQPLCATDTKGKIGLALVPGHTGPVSSEVELSSFEHSAVGPLWKPIGTNSYMNKEDRWFFCDQGPNSVTTADGSIVQLPENVPFTMLRFLQADTNPDVGLTWLELEIEFIDLRPAAQSSVNLLVGTPAQGEQTLNGGTLASQWLQWGANEAMEGLFEWAPDLVSSFFDPGVPTTPIAMPPGSTVAVDGEQTIDAWLDLFLGGASIPEAKTVRPLREWPAHDFVEVKSSPFGDDCVYPKPWSAPVRRRDVCAFKTVAEARKARLAGFDVDEIINSSPNAAGDYTVRLDFQPMSPFGTYEVLYTSVISGGVGTSHQTFEHKFDTVEPGLLIWRVNPTGVENRIVSSQTSTSIDVTSNNYTIPSL